ncbi:MAG: hypothetical protein RJB08_1617 [Actinomycetota bacterium]
MPVRQNCRMRLTFVVLLPPSEGKAEGGATRTKWAVSSGAFGRELGPMRKQVAEALVKAKGGDAKLLGVSGKHLDRAQAANRALVGSPTLPAADRYTGVVWDHLALAGMTATQRGRALDRILVPSGLLGVALAGDPVPDYRLKMGARVASLGGTMAKWWRDAVSEAINAYADGCIVIDMLPGEHRAAYAPDLSRIKRHVAIDLVTPQGKAGGHDAKAAKGALARHILLSSATIKNVDDLNVIIGNFSDQRFRVVTNVN